MSAAGGGRAASVVALVSLAGGCGALEWRPTSGRIALLVALAVMAISIVLGAAAGGGDRSDPASKPSEAGGGWIVLAFLAAVTALGIGTCNSFTATHRPDEPARARVRQPAPSPPCDQAIDAADRAFSALAQAQQQARAAAIAVDRACRVEAPAPPETPATTPATLPATPAPALPPPQPIAPPPVAPADAVP